MTNKKNKSDTETADAAETGLAEVVRPGSQSHRDASRSFDVCSLHSCSGSDSDPEEFLTLLQAGKPMESQQGTEIKCATARASGEKTNSEADAAERSSESLSPGLQPRHEHLSAYDEQRPDSTSGSDADPNQTLTLLEPGEAMCDMSQSSATAPLKSDCEQEVHDQSSKERRSEEGHSHHSNTYKTDDESES